MENSRPFQVGDAVTYKWGTGFWVVEEVVDFPDEGEGPWQELRIRRVVNGRGAPRRNNKVMTTVDDSVLLLETVIDTVKRVANVPV